VLLFYNLLQRYIEDNEFPLVEGWVGNVPDDYELSDSDDEK
jgi:hypothetical protein